MIIADTDVLIDFLRGTSPGADRVARELKKGGLRTTAISRFELLSGVRTARQGQAVMELLEAIPALPLDAGAADCAAEVSRALRDGGHAIGMADCIIAGIALSQNAILLTRNARHFPRVSGVQLATW